MSKRGKKNKWMEIGTTVVLLGFVVILAGSVIVTVKGKRSGQSKGDDSISVTAAPASGGAIEEEEEEVPEADITRYSCIISQGNGSESSGSAFHFEFYDKKGTYKEFLEAGDSKSELHHGTYTKREDSIEVTNEDGEKNILYRDGDYLISQNALYDGEVPDKKTFDKTFVSEAEGESKIEIEFKKDGTYTQRIIRYSAGLAGEDTDNASTGTYKRKGRLIERKKDGEDEVMPYFIYKNRLCTGYYKKEEK